MWLMCILAGVDRRAFAQHTVVVYIVPLHGDLSLASINVHQSDLPACGICITIRRRGNGEAIITEWSPHENIRVCPQAGPLPSGPGMKKSISYRLYRVGSPGRKKIRYNLLI